MGNTAPSAGGKARSDSRGGFHSDTTGQPSSSSPNPDRPGGKLFSCQQSIDVSHGDELHDDFRVSIKKLRIGEVSRSTLFVCREQELPPPLSMIPTSTKTLFQLSSNGKEEERMSSLLVPSVIGNHSKCAPVMVTL